MYEERPKVNWRGGLLYLLYIQLEVLVTAFFLVFAVYPVRMMVGEGALRTLLEVLVLIFVELLVRFFIFLGVFKNTRRLDFGYFIQGYLIATGVRYIFSLITSFAAFSAGMGVLEIGITLAKEMIDPEIITMQEVPKLLYTAVFIVFEGVSLLAIYASFRLAESKREEERRKLLNE